MGSPSEQFEYVGFWTRVQATLIDAVLGLCLVPLRLHLDSWAVEHRSIAPDLTWWLLWTTLYVWCVMRFGGTPGKLILGVRIVDSQGRYLSLYRALRREIFPNLLLGVVGMFQVSRALSTYPESAPRATLLEMAVLLNDYGQPYTGLANVLSYLVLVDIGVILLNQRKRALHDFVAGSYVITKRSCKSLTDAPDQGDPIKTELVPQCAE